MFNSFSNTNIPRFRATQSRGKELHWHGGVIRYYNNIAGWDFIDNQTGSPNSENPHPTMGVTSCSSDTEKITVTLDSSRFGGDPRVSTSIAVPDESLAGNAVVCGTSTNPTEVRIYLWQCGITDLITFDGSTDGNWSSNRGHYDTFSWDSSNNRLVFRTNFKQVSVVNCPLSDATNQFPVVHMRLQNGDTYFTAALDSVSNLGVNQPHEIRVTFWDSGGTLITSPASSMSSGDEFFIYNNNVGDLLDPTNDFEDKQGNIWFVGCIASEP